MNVNDFEFKDWLLINRNPSGFQYLLAVDKCDRCQVGMSAMRSWQGWQMLSVNAMRSDVGVTVVVSACVVLWPVTRLSHVARSAVDFKGYHSTSCNIMHIVVLAVNLGLFAICAFLTKFYVMASSLLENLLKTITYWLKQDNYLSWSEQCSTVLSTAHLAIPSVTSRYGSLLCADITSHRTAV